ncbi:DUF2059 domain-containing protein [Psychrobacter sp. NG254]|uniref:DUF2059 domain-containing protein n=1 Tax=Psychrobacter sp. NG254 TaxID=2782003 RepID=UPI0018888947|nr:DUF2059 domain-containing protein [Psychrobacter sp. NG254]MBF2720009.1 DUF2059 domain-containing protein [Psychrobacter sp. NG254]
MPFFTSNTVVKTSLLSSALAALLFMTGCDKTPETADDTTSAASTAEADATKEAPAPATQDDLVMTTITLDTVNSLLFAPVINSGALSAEQVSCLESRDKDLGKAEVDSFYKSQFTDAELKELDGFYTSEVGKKLITFGNEQLRVMNGEEIATPMADPTPEEMTEIQTFMESPLGVKYMKINNAEGEGSAMEVLNGPIEAEFARCKVDLDGPQPEQPA